MHLQIQGNEQSTYRPGEALLAAINTALLLKRPLLLSGKPGTGKTDCADFVADELSRNYPDLFKLPYALRFNTKSVSQFTDLFYQYDAVGHFGNIDKLRKERFFSLSTLGLAITRSNEPDERLSQVRNYGDGVLKSMLPFGSVVLIDEIDKAPRDFPNDLLAELEKAPLKFQIREMEDLLVEQNTDYPIVILITSNNEKSLPEAFLRRCIFHYIDPPDQTQLLEILKGRTLYKLLSAEEIAQVPKAVDQFIYLRNMQLSKQPSTSELIDWIACLHHYGLLTADIADWKKAGPTYKEKLKNTLSVLAKTEADTDRIEKDLGV